MKLENGNKKKEKKNAIRVIEEVSASRKRMEYQADGSSLHVASEGGIGAEEGKTAEGSNCLCVHSFVRRLVSSCFEPSQPP